MRAFSTITTVFVLGTVLLLVWQSYPVGGLQAVMQSRTSPSALPPLRPQQQHENMQQRHAAFVPLPATLPELYPDLKIDPLKIALGDKLFHEPRLSHNDTIACAHCHNLTLGGTDRLPVSIGINGHHGKRNAPTVFNSGLNFRQFWDGRASTLEQQVPGPLHNVIEMGSNWETVIAKLQQDREYPSLFKALYPEGITEESITDAISLFERSLHTPNAYFDRYLKGEENALSRREKRGYQLFQEYGCVSCHQGINIGGNMYQKLGVHKQDELPPSLLKDLGRYNVTQLEEDRHVFKVPSLRNVAITPPYFHNGEVKTLEIAVQMMGFYQLGRDLSKSDIALIIAFLKTLTGEYNGQPL